MVHDRSQQHRAAQPQPNLADQLERMTCRFDALTERARLSEQTGRSTSVYNDLEEEAQAIARDILAPFRGRRTPTNPPLYVSPDGTKAGW